jgi:hypothetical protein
MNKIIRTITKTVLVTVMALPVASHALVIDFNNGDDLFATLTTSNSTDFDLFFVGTGSSAAFINDLFLNGPNGTFTDNSAQTTATGTYSENGYNPGGGGGSIYDWKISFPTSNSGGGVARLATGEHALWSITATNSEVWDISKIHINAFDGVNSIKLDGIIRNGEDPVPVPEPATLALLGLGLLGVGLSRRRRAR